jgi:nicotinamide-nucleotide amidase
MTAEIIAIGSELLTPFRLDTNSLMLTGRLNRLGIEVMRKVVVGDDRESLDKAIRCALGSDGGAGLLILMGGLGPTEDDRTREALAWVLGRRTYLDENVAAGLRERFRRRGLEMPEINLRQATVVEGAEVLENPKGSAPGQWIEDGGRYIALLPGPPHEAEAVFDRHCLPRLERLVSGPPLVTRVLKIAGMFESQVDQVAAPIYRRYENPATTILASPGEIELHLRATGASEQEARDRIEELAVKLKAALGDKVFSDTGETLPEVVGRLLLMQRQTLAVAESCTGGMVGERLTRVAGSSAYFLGSIVTYSNQAKMTWLDVPRSVLETEGAVSAETARIMAESVRRRLGATLGVAVTGIAGPTAPGTSKPVGLVYLAVADDNGHRVSERQFPGDRQLVRTQAAQAALDMVRRRLMAV